MTYKMNKFSDGTGRQSHWVRRRQRQNVKWDSIAFARWLHHFRTCLQFLHATAATSVARLLTRANQSKTVQARITKSSPSAAWETLVSGTAKLFHKFEGGHPKRER